MTYDIKNSLEFLKLISQTIGSKKSVKINSGIYAHYIEHSDDNADLPFDSDNDIIKIHGSKKNPISLDDIICAYEEMLKQFSNIIDISGDDYGPFVYEGIKYNKKGKMWVLLWGS